MNPNCSTPGCVRPRRSAKPRSAGGLLCPTCRTNTWRRENPDKGRALDLANSRRRYNKFREWIDQIKVATGCADCGFDKHPAALDFDHLPGSDKCFIIARGANKSRAAVEAEIDKCEVVCSNCHRIRTANRRLESSTPPLFSLSM